MPDAYTPNLSLVKPEIGASRDTWGAKLNQNADVIDQFLSQAMPIGAVIDFAGPNAPPGWLICDGRWLSRVTYSQLFAIIGTYWGAGDGSTSFALPSTPGRVSLGPGHLVDDQGNPGDYGFATYYGAQYRQITQAKLPAYNLVTDAQGTHSHGASTWAGGAHGHTADVQGSHQHNTGGDGFGTTASGVHSHGGWTDNQGHHTHNTGLWNLGTGAAAGGFGVISDVFGGRSYPSDGAGGHTHAVGTYDSGAHQHYIFWDGNHAHNISNAGDHYHGIGADGNHTHNVNLGGGGEWFDIRTPYYVITKLIYAGAQAAPVVAGMALEAPLARRLLAAPMRGRR